MDGDKKEQPGGEPAGGWKFSPTSPISTNSEEHQPAANDLDAVTWTASEYIAHHKGLGWYTVFGLAALFAVMLVFAFTNDAVSTIFLAIFIIVFGVAAGQKPRVLTYRLDSRGLTIGSKFYAYGDLRSFYLVQQDAFTSITFVPMARFAPDISIYYAPEDEKKILEALSRHLPMDKGGAELIGSLMHRLRF